MATCTQYQIGGDSNEFQKILTYYKTLKAKMKQNFKLALQLTQFSPR